jgi:hypothetical protein
MRRQSLADGGWFDLDRAEEIEEGTRWNGSNHISLATGSQWDHETLYITRTGRFALYHWSQWQGSGESCREINATDAAEWLILNEKDECDIPEAARKLLATAYDESEI